MICEPAWDQENECVDPEDRDTWPLCVVCDHPHGEDDDCDFGSCTECGDAIPNFDDANECDGLCRTCFEDQ